MDFYQAKNRILALCKGGKDRDAYNGVKKEEYKQLFYAILPHLYSGNTEWQIASGTFLFHAAIAYDRFLSPRPQIVDEELYDNFCRFLTALQKMDGKQLERTAFLHLEKKKWEIYRECSMIPYDSEMETFLAQSQKEVEKIVLTRGKERVIANIEKAKEDLICLIDGIRSGKVTTKIHTTLPYKLSDSDKKITMHVDGVAVVVSLTHRSQGSSLPFAQIAEGNTLSTSGPSQWTTTTCEIDIEANCLIDFLEERKFDTAEEILCKQFPEMKGKVKWPDIVIYTSVFTKLKRALKMSKLSLFQNDIIKKYRQINAKRNGLFHGNSIEIGVEDVEKAFAAYAWLQEKLRN